MIEIMSIVALVVGILFGLWCFGGQKISWLFIMFHSSVFSTKNSFYNLYDMADDEVAYKRYTDHNSGIKKYADYLKLHADARSSAYTTFKETYDELVKSFVTRIVPIALLPAILFWSNWYLYLLGVSIAVVGLILYEIVKNGFRPGFYQRLVVYTAMNTFSKSKGK